MNNVDVSLMSLLVDLAKAREPHASMDAELAKLASSHHLPKEKLAILRSQDVDRVAEAVGQEAKATLEALRKAPLFMMPWFDKQPVIDQMSPQTGHVDKAVRFEIKGRFFVEKAKVYFKRPGVRVDATHVEVKVDASGESTMIGSATFSVAGSYDVHVSNPGNAEANSPEETATLPRGFTVTS